MIYKGLSIVLCLWGLYINSGLPQGEIKGNILIYYTIQSNILCLLYFIGSFCWNLHSLQTENRTHTFLPRLKGALIFTITVTGLIYHFILRPTLFSMDSEAQIYSTANVLVHYIVPIMTVMDWIFFDPKGQFKKFDPFLWLIIPYAYFIFVIIRAHIGGTILASGSRYPYSFINVDQLGWGRVLTNVGLLSLVFLVIGYIYYFIDMQIDKKINKKEVHK